MIMSESLLLPEATTPKMELQPPPRRGHRHRRSAAISGDFDVQGMGIFLPPPSNNNTPTSKSVPSSLHGSPVRPSFMSKFETTSTPNFVLADEDSKVSSLLTPPSETTSSFKRPTAEFSSPNAGSPSSNSSQLRYFMTEDAKFDKNSKVPNAVIDLDDIINKPVLSHSTMPNLTGLPVPIRKPEPPSNFFPRHSLYASPKKNEVSIVEGIREEESENDEGDEIFEADINQLRNRSSHNSEVSSLNSVMAGTSSKSLTNVINDNCSSNSLTSVNSNGSNSKNLSHFNTTSQPSLRSKVRYQSYYNQQLSSPTLTPLNPSSLPSTIPDIKPIKKPLLPHPNSPSILKNKSKSRSPVRNLRFQNTVTFSSNTKNPFQYESITYDISKDFHKEHDYLSSMSFSESVSSEITKPEAEVPGLSNPSISVSSISLSGRSTASASQSANSTSVSPVRHQRMKSSASSSTTTSKLLPPHSKQDRHRRSSSLFSTISSKLHHRRRSSVQSNRKSIIEQQTTDELLGLDSSSSSPTAPTLASDSSTPIVAINDTIIMDDATLSEDFMVGEPGPMIDASTQQKTHKKVLSNISNNLNNTNNINNHNNSKKPLQSKENRSGTKHVHSDSGKLLEPPRKGHIKRGSTSRLLSWISKSKRSDNL